MVQTELKFVRLMEELYELREEMADLGGELNSIEDRDAEYETHDENGDLLPESFNRLEEIEISIDEIFEDILEIAKELGVSETVLDTHFGSCITNRWEIYAHIMSAEIVSLADIANRNV